MSNIHHPGYSGDPKAFWEQTDRAYAHLDTINYQALWADWERVFIPRYKWEGMHVIDYGCGGGWLGRLLFEKYGIAEYWGVDLSERSLEFARSNVPRGKFYTVDQYEHCNGKMEISKDVFCALNVLHHIPTLEGLRAIDYAAWHMQCQHMIITIRNEGKPTRFQPDNPGNAFWTEPQWMRGFLSDDWDLEWKTGIEPAPACRQYLGFKARRTE